MDKPDIEKIFGVTNEKFFYFIKKFPGATSCTFCGCNELKIVEPNKDHPDVFSLQEVGFEFESGSEIQAEPTGNYKLFYKISCKRCGQTTLFDAENVVRKINENYQSVMGGMGFSNWGK
ncbi:hypothetical protein [Shewanella algae]|uniref:hypothetical protein n=1 Tax=Shewanella algae TaxID=38313 RepID=UPI0034D79C3D